MILYGVVVVNVEVTGATWEVIGAAGAVSGAGGAGAITVGENVRLVVTAILGRPVLESGL